MKVLTSNVQFYASCLNFDCDNNEDKELDANTIFLSSPPPKCENCGTQLVLDQECIIKN